jgi:hypothetical protein
MLQSLNLPKGQCGYGRQAARRSWAVGRAGDSTRSQPSPCRILQGSRSPPASCNILPHGGWVLAGPGAAEMQYDTVCLRSAKPVRLALMTWTIRYRYTKDWGSCAHVAAGAIKIIN